MSKTCARFAVSQTPRQVPALLVDVLDSVDHFLLGDKSLLVLENDKMRTIN